MERSPKQPVAGVDYLVDIDLDQQETGAEQMYREMKNWESEQARLRKEMDQLTEDGYVIK